MQETTAEFQLYEKGKDYNNKLHPPYYQTVDKNYRFYSNDQWYGVKANGHNTPVFNFLKQVVDYKISSITGNKTKMQFSVENIEDDTQDPQAQQIQKVANVISGYCDHKWEKLKIDSLIREALLNGAISGDMCFYTYWDPTIDTHQSYGKQIGYDADGNPMEQPVKIMGDFVTEAVDGSNVFFGNANSNNVQTQPYILIAGREIVSILRDKARANGISEDEVKKIVTDTDNEEQLGDRGKIELDAEGDNGKCLYLIKFWKKKGKVMMKIVTKSATVQEETDTGLTLYPIAWANWDLLKNSYHGQAEVTGIIPNQISVNQTFASILYHLKMTAYGKVIYDKTRIDDWNNAIGSAIGANGDISNIVQQIQPGQMNAAVFTAFETAIRVTKDLIGANDAALGNVDPKNTSAILAVQKQSSVPLEGIKGRVYQLIEDLGLIWLDMMINKYTIDRMLTYKQNDKTVMAQFNGSQYKDVPFKLKVDVGPSSYWSEIASMQTLDNLLNQQKINFLQYLERVVNGVIPKKQELMDEIRQQMEQQAQMQQQQMQMQQQAQLQSQQTQQQTAELQQAHKNMQYENMSRFFESLPKQVQEQLKRLPDDQFEKAVMELMNKQGGNK